MASTSSSASAKLLQPDRLHVLFLTWLASSSTSHHHHHQKERLSLVTRLAKRIQALWGLSHKLVLAAFHRLAALQETDASQAEFVHAEIELLVALQHNSSPRRIHSALSHLFNLYTSSASHRSFAFSLLSVLQTHTLSFLRYVDLRDRIHLSHLVQHQLRRPKSPLARHQLWAFLVSPECAALLSHAPKIPDLAQLKYLPEQLSYVGQLRADLLTHWALFPLLSELGSAHQHLHWASHCTERTRFRACAMEDYCARYPFKSVPVHPMKRNRFNARVSDLVAASALDLLRLKEPVTRAMRLLAAWAGPKTELFWVVSVRVAAALDRHERTTGASTASPTSQRKKTEKDISSAAALLYRRPQSDQPSHLYDALRDLSLADLSPRIFNALLLVAAAENVAWLLSLIDIAQQPAYKDHRSVQDTVIEAVLACFEHERSLEREGLKKFMEQQATYTQGFRTTAEKLQHWQRLTRLSAMDSQSESVAQSSRMALSEATSSPKADAGRIKSIIVRAVSASLTSHRTDLALDLLLHRDMPPALLTHQLVQRVVFSALAHGRWSGPSGIARVVELFGKCDAYQLQQVFQRPRLSFDLLHFCLSHHHIHTEEITTGEAVNRAMTLIESFRGCCPFPPEEVLRKISSRSGEAEVARTHLMRMLAQQSNEA